MKIIVGISQVNDGELVKKYALAGVDEFFIGFVPEIWSQNYGWEISCNRREYSKCNYTTVEDIENIVQLIHNEGKRVFLTLNAHEYNNDQIKLLLRMLDDVRHVPFDAFIVSNFALMLELRKARYLTPINLSIGAGGNSYEAIDFYLKNIDNIGRVVLPRKLTIEEMALIAEKAAENNVKLEAFGLADACFFNDEYCFSWHGASNKSFCDSPMYRHRFVSPLLFGADWKKTITGTDIGVYYHKKLETEQKVINLQQKMASDRDVPAYSNEEVAKLDILAVIGKCGLCAIQKFKEFGIDAVKVPLRGYTSSNTNLAVIQLVRTILNESNASPAFCKKVMNAPNFCSGKNCFYNYPYSN